MKKVFMILAVCLMASLVVFSCKKTTTPNKDKEKEEQKEEEKEEEKEFSMEVAIDGDFTEWDTLTDATADGGSYLYEANSNADLNSVLVVKATSDKDFIYLYTEILYEDVFQAEGGPYELGNSNDGFHPSHPGTPGPLWVWVDADGDATGAVSTATEEEALWDYCGFDAPVQYYIAYDVAAGKMFLGWQQMNWPMDGDDYLTSSSEDWGRAFVPSEGWDPNTDNKVTLVSDIAFSAPVSVKDPVSKKDVQVIKIELAMDRSALLPSGEAAKGKAVFGVSYENNGDGASVAHNYLSEISGKVPSGSTPLTLQLK